MKIKIKFTIIIIVAILTQSCSNQNFENDWTNDWTKDNLQGEVLSFSEFSYQAENRFGEIEKGSRKRNIFIISLIWNDFQYKYDKKGNKIEENVYESDGSLLKKYTYKYDEKGNEIEMNTYKSDGSLSNKGTYKYDEKGNKIEENTYKSDGSLFRKWTSKYEFDKQGNWIKRIDFENKIAKFVLEREYEYYK